MDMSFYPKKNKIKRIYLLGYELHDQCCILKETKASTSQRYMFPGMTERRGAK